MRDVSEQELNNGAALMLVRDGMFFFFQAEDGIRDLTVTGVQTCALPISLHAGQIGSNVTSVQGDVSNAQDLDRLFAQFRGERGKLDILFANAGIAKYEIGRASCRERV